MAKAKLSNRLKSLNATVDKLLKLAEKGSIDDIDLCKVYAEAASKKIIRLKTLAGKKK